MQRLLLALAVLATATTASAQSADRQQDDRGATSAPGFNPHTHVPTPSALGPLPLLYSNGGLSTGPTTGSGVAAPAGYEWSEVQSEAGNTTESNTSAGYTCAVVASAFRCADDFTVPAGQTWTVDAVSAYAYQTGYAGAGSPFTAGTLQIWDGPPNDPASTVLFGDTATNQLVESTEAGLYRVFNTTTPPPGSAPGTTRRIWENILGTDGSVQLTAGTYWVDFNFTIAGNAGNFSPPVTTPGSRGPQGANALQFTGTEWQAVIDTGNPDTAPDVPQAFPIQIYGTSSGGTATEEGPNGVSRLTVSPNPMTTQSQVSLTVATSQDVRVVLYDALGREVRVLLERSLVAGQQAHVAFRTADLPAGVYVVRATGTDVSLTERVMVVR